MTRKYRVEKIVALAGTMARLLILSPILMQAACTRNQTSTDAAPEAKTVPKPAATQASAALGAAAPPRSTPSATTTVNQSSAVNRGKEQPASGLKPAPQDATLPRIEAPPPPPKPRPLQAASLRAFGFGAAAGPFLPEDYAIGPLQDARAADKEIASILTRTRGFLSSLAAGRIENDQLYPSGREALAWLLAPLADEAAKAPVESEAQPQPEGPVRARSLRLGKVALDQDAAALKFLLPGQGGRSGLLSLRKSGTAWYVEDLSLDPPEAVKVVFDPASRVAFSQGATNGR